MIENFLSENNCIISNKIIKPTPVLPDPVLSNYITFADPEVERICIENWSSDGIGLTYEDAAAVTDLNGVFSYGGDNPPQEQITSFNELQYFTGLYHLNQIVHGDGQFYACEVLEEITLPNNLITIGGFTFGDCYKLSSIIIPNSVTSIEGFSFSYCISLTSIIIPDSVTSIQNETFSDCSNLASIILPNSLTSIDNGAFNGCNGLISITSRAINPPIVNSFAFLGIPLENIYVPSESVDAYRTAEGWSEYADIITTIIKPR